MRHTLDGQKRRKWRKWVETNGNIVAFNMCCLCVLSEIFAGPAETWPCNLNDINTESEAAGVGKR